MRTELQDSDEGHVIRGLFIIRIISSKVSSVLIQYALEE